MHGRHPTAGFLRLCHLRFVHKTPKGVKDGRESGDSGAYAVADHGCKSLHTRSASLYAVSVVGYDSGRATQLHYARWLFNYVRYNPVLS